MYCMYLPPFAISAPFGEEHSVLYEPGPSPHFDDGDDNRLMAFMCLCWTWNLLNILHKTVFNERVNSNLLIEADC